MFATWEASAGSTVDVDEDLPLLKIVLPSDCWSSLRDDRLQAVMAEKGLLSQLSFWFLIANSTPNKYRENE